MARIGGRSAWIAWPAALLCVGVVGALGWLALPMVPVSVAWAGDMLRAATTPQPPEPAAETLATRIAAAEPVDCRALYPDRLWAELTWTPDVLLSQSLAPPAGEDTSLIDALAPAVNLSCHWRVPDGRWISSTLASVAPDAAPIAEAALRGQGYSCATDAGALVCARTTGGLLEEHTLRDGLWLASAESDWQPEGYAALLARQVWG